jgi:hypothetical protein
MPVLPLGCSDITRRRDNRTRYADSIIRKEAFDLGLTNRIQYQSGSGSSRSESVIIPLKDGAIQTTVEEQNTILEINRPPPLYSILPQSLSVEEGSSILFSVNTRFVPNATTLYWTTGGNVTAADFQDGLTSGSVTVYGNSGLVIRTISTNAVTDPGRGFIIQLRTSSTSGPIVATSSSVSIVDTTPTYMVTESVSSVNEGVAVTFTVATTNVQSGTILYWTNSGTTTGADFTDGENSGSFVVTNNGASIIRTVILDAVASESETIILQIRTGSTVGPIVTTSGTVTVVDKTVTYAIAESSSTVNEGGSVVFTITTTNVTDGTSLYWTMSGTAAATDFTDNAASGSFTITTNSGTISRTLVSDITTEGPEEFVISVRTDSITGSIVAVSGAITINDTSINPTYAVTESVASVEEGASVTFAVATTNVANGTTLYWTNSGTTTGADFTDGENSGSFTITGNSGSIVRTLLLDAVASESETVILQIRTGSTLGTLVATSGTVTVVDKTATYAVAESSSTVDEGSTITFNVTTTNVTTGTTLYWTISGTAVAADFTDSATSGSFTINANVATISRTISSDASLEGSETFTLSIRTGSISGTIVATSGTVTINDTSIPSVYSWGEQASSPTQNWGDLTMTNDGNTLIATRRSTTDGQEGPYISTDGGATWTRQVTGMTFPAGYFTSGVTLALNNGNIMFALSRAIPGAGPVWRSTNGGASWSSATSPGDAIWNTIACNYDGQVVIAGNGLNYTHRCAVSTNGGTTWTGVTPTGMNQINYGGLAVSSDGTRMYAIEVNSFAISRSTNSGTSWAGVGIAASFENIVCSENGLTVLAVRITGSGVTYPYLSTDGGTTWSDVTGVTGRQYWGACAISADGSTMAISSGEFASGTMWISTDGGSSWTEQTAAGSRVWASIAINADGTKIVAGVNNGKIWIATS